MKKKKKKKKKNAPHATKLYQDLKIFLGEHTPGPS